MCKPVSVFIMLLFPFLVVAQTGCNCSPKKSLSEQHRSKAKHLTDYSSFPIHLDTIDVSYIYQWENEFKNKTKNILEGQFSKRVLNSPEDTLYIIQGYLWYVEPKKNDCDYHIEFGSADSSAQRILIEVTEENCALNKK